MRIIFLPKSGEDRKKWFFFNFFDDADFSNACEDKVIFHFCLQSLQKNRGNFQIIPIRTLS
jgi:hypothetical protein